MHGGVCVDKGDGLHECRCKAPFTPPNCRDSDPCQPNPCGLYGRCEYKGSAITCQCMDGLSGHHCKDLKPCLSNVCKNKGVCTPAGDNSFMCNCVGKWGGARCRECQCPVSHDKNQPSSWCDFNGRCQCPMGYVFDEQKKKCKRTKSYLAKHGKACRSQPCKNSLSCINEDDDVYRCVCMPEWYGKNCQYEKKCILNPCYNGGTCGEKDGVFLGCTCLPGFKPPLCKREVPAPCQPSPCQHNAPCIPHVSGGYDCICPDRYTGPHCTIDRCRDCDVHSFCENGKCTCKEGYIGSGYECLPKGCSGQCLHFQTCVDNECRCIPGHRQIANICIPLTELQNNEDDIIITVPTSASTAAARSSTHSSMTGMFTTKIFMASTKHKTLTTNRPPTVRRTTHKTTRHISTIHHSTTVSTPLSPYTVSATRHIRHPPANPTPSMAEDVEPTNPLLAIDLSSQRKNNMTVRKPMKNDMKKKKKAENALSVSSGEGEELKSENEAADAKQQDLLLAALLNSSPSETVLSKPKEDIDPSNFSAVSSDLLTTTPPMPTTEISFEKHAGTDHPTESSLAKHAGTDPPTEISLAKHAGTDSPTESSKDDSNHNENTVSITEKMKGSSTTATEKLIAQIKADLQAELIAQIKNESKKNEAKDKSDLSALDAEQRLQLLEALKNASKVKAKAASADQMTNETHRLRTIEVVVDSEGNDQPSDSAKESANSDENYSATHDSMKNVTAATESVQIAGVGNALHKECMSNCYPSTAEHTQLDDNVRNSQGVAQELASGETVDGGLGSQNKTKKAENKDADLAAFLSLAEERLKLKEREKALLKRPMRFLLQQSIFPDWMTSYVKEKPKIVFQSGSNTNFTEIRGILKNRINKYEFENAVKKTKLRELMPSFLPFKSMKKAEFNKLLKTMKERSHSANGSEQKSAHRRKYRTFDIEV